MFAAALDITIIFAIIIFITSLSVDLVGAEWHDDLTAIYPANAFIPLYYVDEVYFRYTQSCGG